MLAAQQNVCFSEVTEVSIARYLCCWLFWNRSWRKAVWLTAAFAEEISLLTWSVSADVAKESDSPKWHFHQVKKLEEVMFFMIIRKNRKWNELVRTEWTLMTERLKVVIKKKKKKGTLTVCFLKQNFQTQNPLFWEIYFLWIKSFSRAAFSFLYIYIYIIFWVESRFSCLHLC